MKLRDILTYGRNTLSSISDLTRDEEFRKNLGSAGGYLALINIALEVTDQIKDDLQSPKEKAYNGLSRYVLRITKESLKDQKSDIPNNNKEMVLKDMKASLDKAEDKYDLGNWNSYPPDHPAIQSFKDNIRSYLSITNPNDCNEILRRIDSQLEFQAENDPDYKIFNDWWEGQRQYQELIKYLRHIEKLKDDTFSIPNNKPLREYYVQNNVIPEIPLDTLDLEDDKVRNGYPSKEILESIRDFVRNKDVDDSTLVIAGSFGIGKTSAVKMIAASHASEYLSSDFDMSATLPIPIPISLKHQGLKTEDEKFSLDQILNEIVAPAHRKYAKYRPLLLIFDGLEKYKDSSMTLADKIEQLRNKDGYSNIKVIITTTPDKELLLTRQRINVKTYSRLLPFNGDQLKKFFENYQVRVEGDLLTYERAIELELPVEEMFRPLFAWIFSYLETSGESGVKIVEKKNWTQKMKRTWIYMLYFHRMIKGKPREAFTNVRWKESYLQEKKLLRAVAALKQIHKLPHYAPIDTSTVEAEISNFDIQPGNLDTTRIERTYFLSVQYGFKGQRINFLYGSFNDYLIAEYYIESILHNKRLKLNTGIPNKQTIEFLDGLLDLLNVDDNDVEESISSPETSENASLLTSFDYNKGRKHAKEELISAVEDSIEKEYIIFPLLGGNPDKRPEVEGRWVNQESTNTDFEQLWIHRWVSLFILNKLTAHDETRRIQINAKLKEAIRKLIKHSGNLVPSYLKNLKNIDLSDKDLSHVDLFRADLSGANLSKANLFRADLSGANLSKADLSYADMTDINMSDADLSHAILPHSVFSRANLADSDFSEADLSHSKLSYSILSYARFFKSNLSHANLSYANLSDANLSYSTIVEADLSYANLSDASLTCAKILQSQKYHNLVCFNADFNAAAIDSKELLDYLESNHATNVSEKPSEKIEDTVPPQVISKFPAKGCKDVPTWSCITANFSDAICVDSFNSDSFRLFTNGSPVEGTVSLVSPKDKTAFFMPKHTLNPATNYTATISRNVEDYVGNKMESNENWDFTTVKTSRCDKLAILGITASADDGNIPRNAIDNNLKTRWSSVGIGSWIQLDLGEPKNIINLQIAWFKGDRRKYTFTITFSNDREATKKPIQELLNLQSKGDSLRSENYEAGEVQARYIRITVNGNSLNNWASITEISVCGM